MNKVNYDELFPGRFLKSGLFKGRDVTLTIAKVRTEMLPDEKAPGGKKLKGVVAFLERPHELVLNRTNGECFKAMFGRETDAWINKRVTLWPAPYTDNTTGEVSTAIRVRGSPDIASNISFELKLPHKKASTLTMQKTAMPQPAAGP